MNNAGLSRNVKFFVLLAAAVLVVVMAILAIEETKIALPQTKTIFAALGGLLLGSLIWTAIAIVGWKDIHLHLGKGRLQRIPEEISFSLAATLCAIITGATIHWGIMTTLSQWTNIFVLGFMILGMVVLFITGARKLQLPTGTQITVT